MTSTGLGNGTITLSMPPWSPVAVDTGDIPFGSTNPIYTQPLYVAQVLILGTTYNMVIVGTLNDTIYAWDADHGTLLWKRQGAVSGGQNNALYYDDCGISGSAVGTNGSPFGSTLGFAGIVATPVIDTSTSTPVMYVTSLCTTNGVNGREWWLHKIDITTGHDLAAIQIGGSATGANGADDLTAGKIKFMPGEETQRASLLEVNVSGATPPTLLYIAFGTAVPENVANDRYHGWVFGYDGAPGGSFTNKFSFSTTTKGSALNTDAPSCNTPANGNLGYPDQPNWCGHGAGIWMSGKGPAADTISGTSHAFLGVGNGGFQTNGDNWGESILDFTQTSSALGTAPADSFTPKGPRALQPPVSGYATYTFEGLNQNDFDMSTSGILLFTDADGHKRVVTVDKAGYGYLMTQGNLQNFQTNDPGNLFSFGAVSMLCPDQTTSQCAEVHDLAFYNNALYLWPIGERLRSFTSYDNATNLNGTGTFSSSGTAVTGTGTSFNTQLIAGDTIFAAGQSAVVTNVASATQLTVNAAFSPALSGSSFTYNGYFVNPVYDLTPGGSTVGYPGGMLAITSNGTASGSAIVWGLTTAGGTGQMARGLGTLYAYDASTLAHLWDTGTYSFYASSFAVPTVVNGKIYIPTVDKGLLVYSH